MKKTILSSIAMLILAFNSNAQVSWSAYNIGFDIDPWNGCYSTNSNLAIDNNNNKWYSMDCGNIGGGAKLVKFEANNFTVIADLNDNDLDQYYYNRQFKFDSNNNLYEIYNNHIRKYVGGGFSDIGISIGNGVEALSNSLAIDNQDNVWFVGGDPWGWGDDSLGLIKFDGTNFTKFNFLSAYSFYADDIRLTIDNNNNIWFSYSEGNPHNLILFKFNGTTFQQFSTGLSSVSISISDLEIDNQNNVWIATYGDGLYKFDGVNWTNYTTTDGLSDQIIHSVKTDLQGNVWVGSAGGISKFDGTSWLDMTATEIGNVSAGQDIEIDNFGNRLFLGSSVLFINCLEAVQIPTITSSTGTNLCPGSQITLMSSQGDNYNWYRNNQFVDTLVGQGTQQITVNAPMSSANYTVYTNNQYGCRAQSEPITITRNFPYPENICMVTSYNNKNMIVFGENQKSFKYRVYKQNNSTSEFDLIHEQDKDSLSEFLDQSSDINSLSASYKLSTIDSCGNESSLSTLHKTMLLTSSLGTNDNVNLNWNAYEGFTYPNFEIWRSIDGIDYNLLATVANTTFSYIDNNPNNNSYYQIRVMPPAPCTSTKVTYGNVASNIVDKNGNSISNVLENNLPKYAIYPNPTSSSFTITSSLFSNQKIKLFNPSGQLVLEKTLDSEKSIVDVSGLSKGIYFVDFGSSVEKLIIK